MGCCSNHSDEEEKKPCDCGEEKCDCGDKDCDEEECGCCCDEK